MNSILQDKQNNYRCHHNTDCICPEYNSGDLPSVARLPDKRAGFALILLFEAVVPPVNQPVCWGELFNALYERTAGQKSWHPAQEYTWDQRLWLLRRWARGMQFIAEERILPWLQRMSWEELGQLLSKNLPARWKALAIREVILHYSSVQVPPLAVHLATEYKLDFQNAIKEMMLWPDLPRQALSFLGRSSGMVIQDKLEMLYLLLFSETPSPLPIDAPLNEAILSPQEKLDFFSQYGKALLTSKGSTRSSYVLEMVKFYVQEFSLAYFEFPGSRDLLLLIQQSVGPSLNAAMQQRVQDWMVVGAIVSEQSKEPMTLLVRDGMYFEDCGGAIQRLQLLNEKPFIDKFFLQMANTIWDNKKILIDAVTILSPFLIDLPPKKVVEAQRMLLHELATLIGEYVPPYEVFIPYITLSLTYAADLKGSARDNFVKPLFQNLLKNLDRGTYDNIDDELQRRPQYYKVWSTYSMPLRPVTRIERAASIGKAIISIPSKIWSGKKEQDQPHQTLNHHLLIRVKCRKRQTQTRDLLLKNRKQKSFLI